MRTEIALFAAKRNQIALTIENYRNVLHPIRRTPPEVLLEIFSYCVPFVDTTSAEKCQEVNSLNTKLAPWTFGQVCKHWRSIVLESPRLWSSLSLNVNHFLSPNLSMGRQIEYRAIDLLSNYLRRSKDCPLTIAVHSVQILSPIFSVICSHSGRWSNVLLSLCAEAYPHLSMIKGRLPRLKSLHLRNLGGWIDRISAIDAFEYAPNLSTIRVSDIPKVATKLILPWSQITQYHNVVFIGSLIEREPVNGDNMNILSQAVKLQHATLSCSGFARTLSNASLTHRTLSVLTISSIDRSNLDLLTELLDSLTLPSLVTLHITTDSRQHVRLDVHSIFRLVERSHCRLNKLRLKGFRTDLDESSHFGALLKLVHTIRLLGLDVLPNSLLNALMVTEDASHPPLLPRLQHLYVSGSTCTSDLDQKMFVDVVESRVQRTKFISLTMSSKFVLAGAARERLESLNITRNYIL
ncbi:hypothetical protein C8R42DRAFT_340385 [Lentinula raphanica]|nr:hypothetical protein C8R42DRAFT_340385 [Lentinula raphanica]